MSKARSERRSDDGAPEALRPVPDLSGTPVHDAEGRSTGEVYGALADADSGLIRYLDLGLSGTDKHVLVPVGHARIERGIRGPTVRLRAAVREDLAEIPPFELHEEVDGPYQRALLEAHGRLYYGDRYYAHPAYDHSGLYAGEHPIVRQPSKIREPRLLERLSDLPEFQVVEDEPDIRGWPLLDGHGDRVGSVDDLVIDTEDEKVRYALIDLEGLDKRVLVPVGFLQIRREMAEVVTPALTIDDLRALPPYEFGAVTRTEEDRVRRTLDERLDGERRFDRPDFSVA